MLTDSVGQEFRKGTEKTACLCFMMSGPSAGKPWKAGDDSKGWRQDNWVIRDPLAMRWFIHLYINQATWDWGLEYLPVVSPRGFSQQVVKLWAGQIEGMFKQSEHYETPFYGPAWEAKKSGSITSTYLVGRGAHNPTEIQGKGTQILITWWEVMRGELKNLRYIFLNHHNLLLKRLLRRATSSAPPQLCSG